MPMNKERMDNVSLLNNLKISKRDWKVSLLKE
jgi:hypothetical protein